MHNKDVSAHVNPMFLLNCNKKMPIYRHIIKIKDDMHVELGYP